jgi:tetratricopeptide (TPR) repeat protein
MRWQPESVSRDRDKIAALTEAALQSSSKDPALLRRLCGTLLALGKEPDAETAGILARAVAQAPEDAELRTYLARAQIVLGNLDEARAQIDEALRLAPQHRRARILHFNLLVRAGQWDAARSLAEEIGVLEPLNEYLCNARLRGDASKSLCEAQLAACVAELDRNPISTDAIYFKAIALARLGRAQEARETIDLDRFLEIRDLPVPEGFRDVENFRALLAEEIAHNPTLTPDRKTTRGGLQTRRLRQPGAIHVEALLQQIKTAVDDYATRVAECSSAFAMARPHAAKLLAWAVIYEAGGQQIPHRHPYGWLSGVFYVAAPRPKDEDVYRGPLVLGLLDPQFALPSPPWGTKEIEPVPGRLVMFPSYVPHATEKTDSEGVRISVAFDVVPSEPS